MQHPALPRFALGLASVVALAGCVHEVEPPNHDHPTLFVAEDDELLDQLDELEGLEGYGVTPPIPTQGAFTRVGLRYDALGPVAADVRLSRDGAQTWSEWVASELTFHEERANNARVDVDATGATHLQVRFMAPVESELSFLTIDAFVPDHEEESAVSTLTQGLAADGVALPRSAWGARARNCNTASTPSRVTVHHTETPNSDPLSVAARLRQIQNYHIDVRGWCDIGYHFLVARDGNVYQGRRENTQGAHVSGDNARNVGLAFVGNFASTAPPSHMEVAAARVLDALSRTYAIALDTSKVKGHGERGATDCPGARLQARIPALLDAARAGDEEPADDPVDAPADDSGGADCSRVRVVGAGTLNVRPTPGTAQAPRGTLAEGEVVDVLSVVSGQSVSGTSTWYEIRRGTLQGFVSGAYTQCEAAGPAPAPGDDVTGLHGGVERGSARIPRAGLANDTLQGALGLATEPYGTLTAFENNSYVRGTVSWFGGPADTGVTSTETGAITGERLRSLNDPVNASAATIAARPEDFYYVAMRWDYTPSGRAFWENARILVVNPENGRRVVLRAVDWGPNTSTGRILDVSPQALKDLDASTDDELLVAFAAEGAALGVH